MKSLRQALIKSDSLSLYLKWYIYTMEYYPAIKKNEIMTFAATWIDLEVTTLSEVGQ